MLRLTKRQSMPRLRACESTECGPLRSSAVLISSWSMRGCVGGVLNVSDTRRFWDGVWCTPPCFFKECGSVLECLGYRYIDFRSVQAVEKAGDAGARRLGLSLQIPALGWENGLEGGRAANHRR